MKVVDVVVAYWRRRPIGYEDSLPCQINNPSIDFRLSRSQFLEHVVLFVVRLHDPEDGVHAATLHSALELANKRHEINPIKLGRLGGRIWVSS